MNGDTTREKGIAMTDAELAIFGERLYEAVLLTPLPAGSILGLATAIRCNITWADLPRALRFAIFKIAAACLEPPADEQADEAAANAASADATAEGMEVKAPPNGEAPGAPAGATTPEHERAPADDDSGGGTG